MLDLPLPGKKNRIYAFNHTVLIEKGKKYPVTFNKNAVNEESEDFYLEEFDDDKNGKIVIYDAGQGAFYFNHERNISYLTALNSFKLYSGKSISVNIKKRLFYENELYRICNDFFQPDYFVLSFVDCVEDIFCLKDFRKKNPSIKIIPKIETEEGIINAKTIISESDGLMLGRGDLLLYSQMFNLYKYEKEISNICKYENKLCFFSTGYLDSMQNKISSLAYTDPLTGLANRARCEQVMDMLSQEHVSYAIISLDLNKLKQVNDTLGHHEGDRLLQGFATILSDCFMEANLVGRMGGDEFIVVLTEDRALNTTRRIHDFYSMINDWNHKEQMFQYSASYGYAYSYEVPSGSTREVYMLADSRMYEMKKEHHTERRKGGIKNA